MRPQEGGQWNAQRQAGGGARDAEKYDERLFSSRIQGNRECEDRGKQHGVNQRRYQARGHQRQDVRCASRKNVSCRNDEQSAGQKSSTIYLGRK